MADKNETKRNDEQTLTEEELMEQVAEQAQQAADEQDAAADDPVPAADDGETITIPVTEFEQLKAENRDLKERIVRQQADFDNIRKRMRRDMEQTGQRQLASFIRPMLTELDNFGHALAAAKPEHFQDFAMGVTMVRENLLGVLNASGIEIIPCEGVFDPALHEVVAETEDAEQPRGTIAAVHRQGYKLGEQVIRAAQVVVTKPPAEQ
ncbi:MAG: nucleotide exchange factor GrpE [Planctomycetota bacterium]